eukprot:m.87678 g.87678  ORF g.87678 m.87678 type:complete len:97 (-) comp9719_c0_seq1:134-424(-)
MAAMEGGWWSRPKPNVLCVYLREDLPSETVMAHMARIFTDHGIPPPQKQKDGTHRVEIGAIKFAATISTGSITSQATCLRFKSTPVAPSMRRLPLA